MSINLTAMKGIERRVFVGLRPLCVALLVAGAFVSLDPLTARAAVTGTDKGYGLTQVDACAQAKSSASASAELNRSTERMLSRNVATGEARGDFDVKVEGCDCSQDRGGWTCSASWELHGH